jgi:hypothetical protein
MRAKVAKAARQAQRTDYPKARADWMSKYYDFLKFCETSEVMPLWAAMVIWGRINNPNSDCSCVPDTS